MVAPSVEISTLSTEIGLTVQLTDTDCPAELVAVIVAEPTAMAVTRPDAFTVMTDGSEEDHATDLSAVVAGSTVAVNCIVSPALIAKGPDGLTVMLSAAVGDTVTSQKDVIPEPSAAVAVIRAVPSDTAVTIPVALTVATSVLDDFQVTDLSVAVEGATVAESWIVFSIFISAEVRLMVMDSTGVFPTVTV